MIQLYADDMPVTTDNLTQMKTSETLNRAGSMTIGLPPDHPARDAILAPKTIITLKEDGETQFRGRVLTPQRLTDFQDVIICEGEMAFLQDARVESVFCDFSDADHLIRILTQKYNEHATESMQLEIGTIATALDGMEVHADQTDNFVSVFHILTSVADSLNDGSTTLPIQMTIKNGVMSFDRNLSATQSVLYGQNLISYTETENRADFCTVLYADGSGDGGANYSLYQVQSQPYIKDDDAVDAYGWIAKYMHFEHCTSASDLLTKAQRYLARHKSPTSNYKVRAFDRHWIDKGFKRFRAGQRVRVESSFHNFYREMLLQSVTCDWLHPQANTIEIGSDYKLV